MTEIILFHVLAATAGTAFGLLAIWAGLGRLHWSMRFIPVTAGIVSLFPVPAFDLSLVFVSQALVVVVPLLLVRRFTLPPADGTATEAPTASHPWRRFTVADLLRATLLIAAVIGVVAYLPGEVRESWWKYVSVGAGFGVATLVRARAPLGHRKWWLRWGFACVVAFMMGTPINLDKTVYLRFKEAEWPWSAVTLSVGLVIALCVFMARAAGLGNVRLPEHRATTDPAPAPGVATIRQRLAGICLGVFSIVVPLLPAIAYYEMVHPAPIPLDSIPEPNAYADLLRIAAALPRTLTTFGTPTPMPLSAVSVQRRCELFDELHAALRRPGRVPLQFESQDSNFDTIQMLRDLSRERLSEAETHWLASRKCDAQRGYRDILQLGLASSRGGLFMDWIVGSVIQGMGIEVVHKHVGELSSDERREWVAILQSSEADWESSADVDARELDWEHRVYGWPTRISFTYGTPLGVDDYNRDRVARLRMLICELAISEFATDHGGPPEDLAGLAPQYLPEVPLDPFSGRPLVYRSDLTGYVLYSVGQNGLDDGGTRGASWENSDLFLDPAPLPGGDDAGED